MLLKFISAAIVACTALSSTASGLWITTNEYTVSLGSSVHDEQWVYATQADVSGTFENDLIIGTAAPLELSGIYQGNIWASAPLGIEITGSCGQNVRINANTIRIDGSIAGNLLAVGNTVVLSTNAMIHGHARIYAAKIVQEGTIEGNAIFSAPVLATFAGRIDGDVSISSQEIIFTPDARIAGNFEYQSRQELLPAEGIIGGEVLPRALPSLFETGRLMTILIGFVAAIIAGLPFITLFPMTTAMSSQLIRHSPWKCLLAGFITSLALPFFGLMCFSSYIGIPLGILIFGAWLAMGYLAHIIMALVIGNLVLRRIDNSVGKVVGAMSAGLCVLYAALIFPSIGMPVAIMVLWLGMGSLILSLLEKRRLILQVPANLKKLQELRDEKVNLNEEEK